MSKKRVLKATHPSKATAEHSRDAGHDYVKIGELHVLVTKDGDWWLARGLQIDYAAQGKSLDEVKENFCRGLMATADAYLKEFGSIEKLLRPSPDVLREMANASERKILSLSLESVHETARPLPSKVRAAQRLPFSGISFFQKLSGPIAANA